MFVFCIDAGFLGGLFERLVAVKSVKLTFTVFNNINIQLCDQSVVTKEMEEMVGGMEEVLDLEESERDIIVYVVEVDKELFSLLQSFVDSSTKLSYPWNKPYFAAPVSEEGKPNIVTFKKSGRWMVEIFLDQCLVVLRREKKPIYVVDIYPSRNEIRMGEKKFDENVEFIPKGNEPPQVPLPAKAIIEKGEFYLRLAERVKLVKITL